ncbi:hypothetical protein [Rubripirellula reticaptiva]|uniref:Uncharacterized protein n=1 Tax=Rubripirellula reticaptiva TaxID=2528013 RepID=A0A5C6FA45_9BACT|nr:hypothetical protein [Rubripirellula reticaptiva]TWU58325.1 hypothetical protein Poly59_12360 [Rubripirellula reticaptiva]
MIQIRRGSALAWATAAFLCAAQAASGVADDPVAGQTVSAASVSMPIDTASAKASVQWLVDKALVELPRTFDGDKGWGDTKRVWAGVSMKMDGLKLKTHRKFRDVDHGRWIRYEVTMPKPGAARNVDVTIDAVTPVIDPVSGQERWKIDSTIVAPVHFSARVQRHNLGIQLFSVTVTGKMKVRMTSSATIGFYPDYRKIPPDLVIDPVIEQANLKLESFEVDRVSHIGGDAAEAWGEIMQEVLVERFVQKQDEKLVAKLNKSIGKKRDDLRISLSDWFTMGAVKTPMK